ncbi:hypothetical protein NPIL_477461 [Nephila pilipes]|uniref:Uncharacterized protein n=1 Tax=Nephila pilipes TaxID=299642 RepID=A0A8X6U322_NEPPI|nr:hypothetical protein NPIL_477461 [Nephila pilipes]
MSASRPHDHSGMEQIMFFSNQFWNLFLHFDHAESSLNVHRKAVSCLSQKRKENVSIKIFSFDIFRLAQHERALTGDAPRVDHYPHKFLKVEGTKPSEYFLFRVIPLRLNGVSHQKPVNACVLSYTSE